jgi:peptide/nickel transport system substrate-binding protein
VNKKLLATAGFSVVALMALAGCGGSQPASQKSDLVVGVTYVGDGLNNPFYYGNLIFVQSQAVYEPLVMENESGQFDPWLAKEFELSDDRLTLSLTLRDDVDFTDGEHLTAPGVEAYMKKLFATETALGYVWAQGMTITATGEYDLELTVSKPIDYSWMNGLYNVPIATPASAEDPEMLATAAVGTGPYVLDEVVTDVSASYVKNDAYWNADAYPYETVTFKAYSDSVASLNALKTGQIDAAQIDSGTAGEAESAGLAVHRGGGLYNTLVITDRTGEMVPALGDLRVRQAISLAIDREGIAEAIERGYGEPEANQLFTEGQIGYRDDAAAPVFDVERARELMAEAGYADGFEVTIPTTGDLSNPQYTNVYEAIIQQSLADIGITVTYERLELGALFDAWNAASYPMVLMQMFFINTLSVLQDFSFFGRSLDGVERSLVDTYLNGAVEDSTAAAAELGQRLVEDEVMFVPFSKPAVLWATNADVTMKVGDVVGLPRLLWFDLAD